VKLSSSVLHTVADFEQLYSPLESGFELTSYT